MFIGLSKVYVYRQCCYRRMKKTHFRVVYKLMVDIILSNKVAWTKIVNPWRWSIILHCVPAQFVFLMRWLESLIYLESLQNKCVVVWIVWKVWTRIYAPNTMWYALKVAYKTAQFYSIPDSYVAQNALLFYKCDFGEVIATTKLSTRNECIGICNTK